MAEEQATTPISETDSLKLEILTLRGQLKERDGKIAGLEKAAAEKDGEINAAKQLLDKAGRDSAGFADQLQRAVAAYQELAQEVNPGPVAEMIHGDSIVSIKESMQSARALVEKVKQEVGAENARLRVPAGAPQRTPPDLSGLTPREKIKYGMEG
jgi:chromosome segregation ATPase